MPRVRRLPTQQDYEALAEFRAALRGFLSFSEEAARAAGLTPRQHQALLAIKGSPGGTRLSVGDIAARLRLRHNTTVELVNRLLAAGQPMADGERRAPASVPDGDLAAADGVAQPLEHQHVVALRERDSVEQPVVSPTHSCAK